MIGFFHQPAYGRPSCVLDMVEEFRPIVDALVLRLINRRQLGSQDFEQQPQMSVDEVLDEVVQNAAPEASPAVAGNAGAASNDETPQGVYLSHTGRRVFLTEFFRRMRERIDYPPKQARLEVRQILREQVYHLARVIEEKDPEYVGFVPR